MAIARDERLVTAALGDESTSKSPFFSKDEPYRSWPVLADYGGLRFKQLETFLRNHQGEDCDIRKLTFRRSKPGEYPKWACCAESKGITDLRETFDHPETGDTFGELYLVATMKSEPMRLLGHNLRLDPRFFNMTWSGNLRTGQARPDAMHFGLPFMDKLDKHKLALFSQQKGEIKKTVDGDEPASADEVMVDWHYTRINVLLSERTINGCQVPFGMIVFDWADPAIRKAIETLGGRFNEDPEKYSWVNLPDSTKIRGDKALKPEYRSLLTEEEQRKMNHESGKVGLANIMTELLYIIQATWSAFVKEGQQELNEMDQACVRSTDPNELIRLTKQLHTMRLKLGEASRRMVQFKNLIEYVQQHEYLSSVKERYPPYVTYSTQAASGMEGTLHECKQLISQASTLTSLIYNINAIEEGKRSNILASSMRRVGALTFIYLPLMLVASVLGMNVTEIVSSASTISIWVFFAISVPVMLLTYGAWAIWSRSEIVRKTTGWILGLIKPRDVLENTRPKRKDARSMV